MGESGNHGGVRFPSPLIDHMMTSSDADSRITATVAPLFLKLEAVIQSVKELSERTLNRSTERNLTSKHSRSSGSRFHYNSDTKRYKWLQQIRGFLWEERFDENYFIAQFYSDKIAKSTEIVSSGSMVSQSMVVRKGEIEI